MMPKQIDKYYWNSRYQSGGNSGGGSYGQQVAIKLKEIKKVSKVSSILDVGFGDLNTGLQVAAFFPEATYLGLDISKVACEKAQARKLGKRFQFKVMENSIFDYPSDLVLCLDVLWHINRVKDYEDLLASLKKSWKKTLFLTAYRSEYVRPTNTRHIKLRKFNPDYFSGRCERIPYGNKTYLYRFDQYGN